MQNRTDPRLALLALAGNALYGLRWKRPLSRELDVPLNTCQLWETGIRAIPPEIWPQILKLVEEKQRELRRSARMLKAQILDDRQAQLARVARQIRDVLRRD